VGRLGVCYFPKGMYFYCGNAFGGGGLNGRINHHLENQHQQPTWHIDYLLPQGHKLTIYYSLNPQPLECVWSQALAKLPQAFIPVPRFGATDCHSGCPAHLIGFPLNYDLTQCVSSLVYVADKAFQVSS